MAEFSLSIGSVSDLLRRGPATLPEIPTTVAASVPRPVNRKARRLWLAELERMGRHEVQERLYAFAVGPETRFNVVDAGILFGANRFPSRAFVERWLQQDDDSTHADWRVLTITIMAVVAVMFGLLLLM